jgi:VWFA-related protein
MSLTNSGAPVRFLLSALIIFTLMISLGHTDQARRQHSIDGSLCPPDSAICASRGQELHHDVSAIVKLVPVRVLNPEGHPVRGLKKEDFVLYEDGQRRVITEFEIHEPSGPSALPRSEANAAEILQDVGRKYFFVLDMQGSDRLGNGRAKDAVLAFSSVYLQPGDEVCLLTFGVYTGLVLRQYLTADMDKIKKAVDHSIEMASIVGAPQTEFIDVPSDDISVARSAGMDDVTDIEAGGGKDGVFRPGHPSEKESLNRIILPGWGGVGGRTYADFDLSMSELAKALAYIPGSKIVIYFSTRVPNPSVSRMFSSASATIFTVNTNSVPAKGGGAYAGVRRRQKEAQGRALADLAETSGGRYFEDAAAAETIANEVTEMAGYYYVLGYYIHPSWEGRAHAIKVEVATPGLRVLAQSGYNDPKPFAQWSDIEKQLHFFDLALSDGPVRTEALDIPVEVLCRSMANEPNVAILTKLQVDERTGLPPGRTEGYVLIFDQDHQIVQTWRSVLVSAAAKTKMLYPYVVTWLPPGRYECRVVFRDVETGRSAASRKFFSAPEKPAPGRGPLICVPPLLLEKAEGTFARLGMGGKQGSKADSLLSFYPLWPRDCFPLLGETEISEIYALLPILPSSAFDPGKDIAIELLDEKEEKSIPVEWQIIDSRIAANNVTYCFLRMEINDQVHFRIRFTVTDALTKTRESVIVAR